MNGLFYMSNKKTVIDSGDLKEKIPNYITETLNIL